MSDYSGFYWIYGRAEFGAGFSGVVLLFFGE
jgi:hypothetical protein